MSYLYICCTQYSLTVPLFRNKCLYLLYGWYPWAEDTEGLWYPPPGWAAYPPACPSPWPPYPAAGCGATPKPGGSPYPVNRYRKIWKIYPMIHKYTNPTYLFKNSLNPTLFSILNPNFFKWTFKISVNKKHVTFKE